MPRTGYGHPPSAGETINASHTEILTLPVPSADSPTRETKSSFTLNHCSFTKGENAVSTDLNDLVPEFRAKVVAALKALADESLVFRPYFTLREPVTQARLWRQSRSKAVVDQQVADLRAQGCDFIAACFDKAGPADGPWATNALPGQSWHQYGEAVDCFLVDASGNPVWESPKYARFGQVGDQNNMWWGGHFGDNDHWQNRRIEPPEVFGSIKQINDALAQRWGAGLVALVAAPALAAAAIPSYQPTPGVRAHLGGFAGLIPGANANTQAFVHPPRFLGAVAGLAGPVLVIDSALELDTDGWTGDQGNSNWQSGTSLRYADGITPLDANQVPYFVLPLPITWPNAFGVSLGDYAAVLFNDRVAFGVFGDFGPRTKIGEGSVELLRRLGQERVRPNGTVINAGTEPGVLTIVFPGSGSAADRASQQTLLAGIDRNGRDLFDRLTA
jgi:peptidoglycan LD-endopeptidase CwlK